MRDKILLPFLALLAGSAAGQNPFLDASSEELDLDETPDNIDPENPPFIPDIGGLRKFLEYEYLGTFFIILVLATLLGALIGYQPKYGGKVDSIEAVETPKTSVWIRELVRR